jgi:GT2 family glycosyltransferase
MDISIIIVNWNTRDILYACPLVRKKAIDEVGMFDERYFFFFEETDWAHQMKKAGWKIFHVLLWHFHGNLSVTAKNFFKADIYLK